MKIIMRVLITLVALVIVFGALGGIKGLQIKRTIAHGEDFVPPPQTVTVAQAVETEWESVINAVGSLQAVKGVVVAAELPGKTTRIAFKAGSRVKAGQLLLQQDVATEKAQMKVSESEVRLALRNLKRARELFKENVIPKARLDELEAAHEQALAQLELIKTTIAKKSIRAPFTGRLGIRKVNQGEFLQSGQPIVSLQALDPIYVNFQLPQQFLSRIKNGQKVRVGSDTLAAEVIEGKISVINSDVDSQTRNIEVQAILPNASERLRPGMFANVGLVLPAKKRVVKVPVTAINYAPYSDSIFIVEKPTEENQPQQLVLRQQFVKLGQSRGDFIEVLQGLQPGQTVVSTGVFKLRNGQSVVVDNKTAPTFEINPQPSKT